MSCKRTVESFSPIEIKITCIDKKSICEIEDAAMCALKQKLDKLSLILKNLNVYCHKNVLLVNDRYGICKDFEDIACAFGLSVQMIDCGLRGKSYILQDALTDLIEATHQQFSISEYANSQTTAELISPIEKNIRQGTFTSEVAEILREIKVKGYYSIEGKQKVTTVYYDGSIISQNSGEIVSDEARLTGLLQNYLTAAKSKINKANDNLRDGTVKLLYSRAKQMGFSVKEERKGEQVQLVLVRCG